MPPPELSTDLVIGSSWCPLGLGTATIQAVYPLGQSIWIIQLVDASARIDAMGNREDLLAGALECLKTKGWARTTVRDIAAAAGVNHAAIGYHFGSREALLIEAFTQAIEAWGAETEAAVRTAVAAGAGPREQYEAFWRQVIASYDSNRWLWLATIEAARSEEHTSELQSRPHL